MLAPRTRCTPSPTKPRPAGVWSLLRFAGSGQARSRLWGGVGGGGDCARQRWCVTASPPSPPLPHKGGGSRPSVGRGNAPRSRHLPLSPRYTNATTIFRTVAFFGRRALTVAHPDDRRAAPRRM